MGSKADIRDHTSAKDSGITIGFGSPEYSHKQKRTVNKLASISSQTCRARGLKNDSRIASSTVEPLRRSIATVVSANTITGRQKTLQTGRALRLDAQFVGNLLQRTRHWLRREQFRAGRFLQEVAVGIGTIPG